MRARLVKISSTESKIHPGNFYYFYFQGEDGKSYKTMTSEKYNNFARWARLVEAYKKNVNKSGAFWIKGLRTKGEGLIDADSPAQIDDEAIVSQPEAEEVTCDKCGEPLTDLERETYETYCQHCGEKLMSEREEEITHPDKASFTKKARS